MFEESISHVGEPHFHAKSGKDIWIGGGDVPSKLNAKRRPWQRISLSGNNFDTCLARRRSYV